MKKQQLLFLLIAYALSVTQIFAQENAEKQSRFDNAPEPQRRRWQATIEIDKLVKAIQGQQTLYGLTLTKYSMDKPQKSAIRYSFYGYGSRINYGGVADVNYKTTINLSLGINYEFQHQWGSFMLFYGPGLGVYFGRSGTYLGTGYTDIIAYQGVINNYVVNTGLYFGARFFLNSRLSMNISSGIKANYSIKNDNIITTNEFTGIVYSDKTLKDTFFSIDMGQVNLGLGIHF